MSTADRDGDLLEPKQPSDLAPGSYSLILHRHGLRKVSVVKILYDLYGRRSLAEAKELAERAPVVLLSKVSEDAASEIASELVAIEADVLVRFSEPGERAGDRVDDLHPLGPAFTPGAWRLVLLQPSQPDIHTKLALMQLIPDLHPGRIDSLVEAPGQAVVEHIDLLTAQRLSDAFEKTGAEMSVEPQPPPDED